MHRSREGNKGREGKIQKRVKMCKRKGKVLFMKISNKREEEGETRRVMGGRGGRGVGVEG